MHTEEQIVPSLLYHEYASTMAQRPFVECFWSMSTSTAVNTRVPPDGCIDLVFSPDLGLRIVGAMTAEQSFVLGAGTQIVGVRFRPGMARAILSMPMGQLTDTFVDFQTIWPQRGKELLAKLGELRSASQAIGVLQQAIKIPKGKDNPLTCAIQSMTLAHGKANLDYLASQVNLSPRQFRRRCYEEAGLTPKHLCRILRFRRARQLWEGSLLRSWSHIAAEAGYFDQAHLIRDFREFTGRTPMSVLSNTQSVTLA